MTTGKLADILLFATEMGDYRRTMLQVYTEEMEDVRDFGGFSGGNGSILEYISTGIVFVDRDGILAYLNSTAEDMLRVDRESVLGKRIDMLSLRTFAYRVLSENSRDHAVKMNIDGRVLSVRSRRVSDSDGEVAGEITELTDVTDERHERQRREEFVAMMTHDLKGPLTAMLGNVQAIRLGMVGKVGRPLKGQLQQIEKSGRNLRSMIEEVIDYYRLDRGLLPLVRNRCSLRRMLERCRRAFLQDANVKGVTLTLAVENRVGLVSLDDRQMTRVFYNLLGNALKFTPAGGSVTMSVHRGEDGIAVTFSDTGIGIPVQDLTRIFSRYYRSSNAGSVEGSGLGLAICKSIVEAHGGDIHVSSREGYGSSFRVLLPLDAV